MPEGSLPFGKDAQPELSKPGARKPLTREQIVTICIRQVSNDAVRCGCGCGAPLNSKCIDEHIVPRETLPAEIADRIDNRALYNVPCAKLKTVADQAVIGHWRRVRGDSGQAARRAKNGPKLKSRSALSAREEPGEKTRWRGRTFPKRVDPWGKEKRT